VGGGRPAYYRCRMRVQYLGMTFREPVAVTKIRQRRFYIDGTNPSDGRHPKNTKRPAWKRGFLPIARGDWDLQRPHLSKVVRRLVHERERTNRIFYGCDCRGGCSEFSFSFVASFL